MGDVARADDKAVVCPKSVVSQTAALCSLAFFLSLCALVRSINISVENATILFFLGLIVIHGILFEEHSGSISNDSIFDRNRIDRLLVKFLGLAATILVILFLYSTFPHYDDQKYNMVRKLAYRLAPIYIVLAPIYVTITDRRMANPKDGLYMAGLIALGRLRQVDWAIAKQYALGWLVKAFFLPLMLSYFMDDLAWWMRADLSAAWAEPRGWYPLAYRFIFFMDVFLAAAGYVATLRLLNTHIRSTESTLLGWAVCLVCYQPFWRMFYENYVNYEDGTYWGNLFPPGTYFGIVWGCAILACLIIYVWSTLCFGIRFSNLTHRGILTSGPYRFTKHPSYIAKNISWWLVAVPFVSNSSVFTAINMSFLLFTVNCIYFMRARTEERHLQADPTYVAYSAWIAEHGLFAKLRRFLMRYADTAFNLIRRI